MIDREHLELTLVGDDPEPVDRPRWPLLLAVVAVVLAAVLVAWSAGRWVD